MPELPEIIIIRDDLKKVLLNKKVVDITTYNNYPLNPSNEYFTDFVLDKTIMDVFNIAKLLVISFSSGYYICVHLKMTGNILYNNKDKYTKITLELSDGNKLHYSTIRKLGYFEVWGQEKLDTYSQRIGKTALDPNLEPHEFISLIKRKKTTIRNALLDQRLISGVGNIYANDALYLSKIHPKTRAFKIKDVLLFDLFNNLQLVLNSGINNRGSSMSRFKDIFGSSGTHQDHFLVYGNKGKLCTHCTRAEIEFEKDQGRGLYFCPNCQILES